MNKTIINVFKILSVFFLTFVVTNQVFAVNSTAFPVKSVMPIQAVIQPGIEVKCSNFDTNLKIGD